MYVSTEASKLFVVPPTCFQIWRSYTGKQIDGYITSQWNAPQDALVIIRQAGSKPWLGSLFSILCVWPTPLIAVLRKQCSGVFRGTGLQDPPPVSHDTSACWLQAGFLSGLHRSKRYRQPCHCRREKFVRFCTLCLEPIQSSGLEWVGVSTW